MSWRSEYPDLDRVIGQMHDRIVELSADVARLQQQTAKQGKPRGRPRSTAKRLENAGLDDKVDIAQ